MRRRARVAPLAVGIAAALGTVLGAAGCAVPLRAPVMVGQDDDNRAVSAGPATASAPGPAGPAELIGRTIPAVGNVVIHNALVVYRYDRDTANPPASNCRGTCTKTWQPVLTNGPPRVHGIDVNLVGTVTRPDGTVQVTINGWPVYHYVGDLRAAQPPTCRGQKAGNAWWVIDMFGKRNATCVPTLVPAAPHTPGGR